ncbi:MAG: ornithine cyclodeaminase [Verrucomicrobia bacterium]|nr:ornithine cyclodeaminase [Verrucomicrobiota bacterium]
MRAEKKGPPESRALYLNAEEVRRCLPMADAISAMKRAFAQLARGEAALPPRMVIPLPEDRGDYLLMPALLDNGAILGAKQLTLLPGNPKAGRPLIHALMTLFDGAAGEPLAIMDGGALTAVRTGAVSGAATDFLARPDAATAAILGAGRQGRTQLEAICCVRPIKRAFVFDVVPEAAQAFAAEMSRKLGIEAQAVKSAGEAVSRADIVCAATTSAAPVFSDADVRPGTHLNAVGVYHPDRHETPPETVARAKVVVDQLEAARQEAGDLVIPIKQGLFAWNRVHAELGELAVGRKSGRETAEEITFFKSVGLAIQDVAAAARALENARKHRLGAELG